MEYIRSQLYQSRCLGGSPDRGYSRLFHVVVDSLQRSKVMINGAEERGISLKESLDHMNCGLNMSPGVQYPVLMDSSIPLEVLLEIHYQK